MTEFEFFKRQYALLLNVYGEEKANKISLIFKLVILGTILNGITYIILGNVYVAIVLSYILTGLAMSMFYFEKRLEA